MHINPGEPKKVEKPSVKKIIYELVLTLNSRARPYTEIRDLERDFQVDTGYCPRVLAFELGFPTFEAFIKCDKMKNYVSIRLDEDGETTLYLPHPNPKIKHIRSNLLASDNYVESKKEKEENEKMARAMQPEFRGMVLEGKRRLVDLAYQLGAEIKDISYQELQKAYLEKYKVMLAKDELRKFFARDCPSRILIELCCDEFKVSRSDLMSGMMFLRLSKPYQEIVQLHTEKLALQEQYEKSKKSEQKQRKFAPFPYDRSVRRKGLSTGMDLMLRPVLPKIAMEYTDELNVEAVFGDSSEQHYEKPSKFSVPRSLTEKHVKFAFPQNSSSCDQQSKTDNLFPSSLFNNKDGGCTSSNLCKSFEEEYGGKANRNVQNTLRHLHQVHRRSSSSSSTEQDVASEGSSRKVIRKTVEQRNASACKQSCIPISDNEEMNIRKLPSIPLCNRADGVVVTENNLFLSSTAVEHDVKNKRVMPDGQLPGNNTSLPPMAGHTRWKPEDSSDEEQPGLSKPIVLSSPEVNISHSSSDRGFERAEALRDFIHAVVHLRSPEFVDLKFLLKTLVVLDPNYEDVLESLSLSQFIKRNCNNAVLGMYKDWVKLHFENNAEF